MALKPAPFTPTILKGGNNLNLREPADTPTGSIVPRAGQSPFGTPQTPQTPTAQTPIQVGNQKPLVRPQPNISAPFNPQQPQPPQPAPIVPTRQPPTQQIVSAPNVMPSQKPPPASLPPIREPTAPFQTNKPPTTPPPTKPPPLPQTPPPFKDKPQLPFDKKLPPLPKDVEDRINRLTPQARGIWNNLPQRDAMNDWNDDAFGDYLDALQEGDNEVDVDGEPMTGRQAAEKMRNNLKGKGKKGKGKPAPKLPGKGKKTPKPKKKKPGKNKKKNAAETAVQRITVTARDA